MGYQADYDYSFKLALTLTTSMYVTPTLTLVLLPGLRGLVAVTVVFVHFPPSKELIVERMALRAWMTTIVFFILSGHTGGTGRAGVILRPGSK